MSKVTQKQNNLGSLQKKVLNTLALNAPLTINEARKHAGSSYKPTWLAFKSLKKKELIREYDKKYYRGNKYPTHSLTLKGLVLGLRVGAIDPQKAHKIRLKNKIPLPTKDLLVPHIQKLVKLAESSWPKTFYQTLTEFDLTRDSFIPFAYLLSAHVSSILHLFVESEARARESSSETLDTFKMPSETFFLMLLLARSIVPNELRELLDQKMDKLATQLGD